MPYQLKMEGIFHVLWILHIIISFPSSTGRGIIVEGAIWYTILKDIAYISNILTSILKFHREADHLPEVTFTKRVCTLPNRLFYSLFSFMHAVIAKLCWDKSLLNHPSIYVHLIGEAKRLNGFRILNLIRWTRLPSDLVSLCFFSCATCVYIQLRAIIEINSFVGRSVFILKYFVNVE